MHNYVTTFLPCFFYYVPQIEARLVLSRFNKGAAHNASMFHWNQYNDESVKRQFKLIADIGTDGLSDENKLKQVSIDF